MFIVFAGSNTEIEVSNHSRSIYNFMHFFCACLFLIVVEVCRQTCPSQRVLKVKIRNRKLKNALNPKMISNLIDHNNNYYFYYFYV
jgi:hypothetical protein